MDQDILIVEDSLTQRIHLKKILAKNGFEVREAENGLEALTLVRERTPALIISDIVMPEMDGYAFCSAIKKDPAFAGIPVLLLTYLSNPRDVIKGLQAGADNFITKPYDENLLMSRVKYMLVNAELRHGAPHTGLGLQIMFGGEKYFIDSERIQIVDLLLSTYETAVQKNSELEDAYQALTEVHRELKAKNEELERLNQDKTRFLRIAAHDIRNPVGTILGYSALLLEDKASQLDEEGNDWVRVISEGSEFILRLLNDLLDIAVIESGVLQLNPAEVDPVALVRQNVKLNAVTADRKGIALAFRVGSEPRTMVVDQVKIEQVLNNLISNAIKFSVRGTTITVSIDGNVSEAVIAVADQGPGIPADEIDKLFTPFAKISVRSTDGERSTGLGLSIVKKIIEAHGGRIWVESVVGCGTTFFFALPYEPAIS